MGGIGIGLVSPGVMMYRAPYCANDNGAYEQFVSLFLSVDVRSMIVVCEVTKRELIPAEAAGEISSDLYRA